jgi:hypothetical protein
VENACGLDALAGGIRVSNMEGDAKRMENFQTNAMYFLQWVQDPVPESSKTGRCGLGYGGVQALELRLDATGHAMCALAKLRNL